MGDITLNCSDMLDAWSSKERKPCPFCGEKADIVLMTHALVGLYTGAVRCKSCGAMVQKESKDRETAIDLALEQWNTRSENA